MSHPPPDDFIDMLKQNCCLSGPHFPPPAIVKALQDYVTFFWTHAVRAMTAVTVKKFLV